MAIDGEYSILKYVIMGARTEAGTVLMLLETPGSRCLALPSQQDLEY